MCAAPTNQEAVDVMNEEVEARTVMEKRGIEIIETEVIEIEMMIAKIETMIVGEMMIEGEMTTGEGETDREIVVIEERGGVMCEIDRIDNFVKKQNNKQ